MDQLKTTDSFLKIKEQRVLNVLPFFLSPDVNGARRTSEFDLNEPSSVAFGGAEDEDATMKEKEEEEDEAMFECLEKKRTITPKLQMHFDLNSLPENLEKEQIPSPSHVTASSVPIPAGVTNEIEEEEEEENETTARIAAETIVALSSVKNPASTGIIYGKSTSNPSDSLQWFADVIISNHRSDDVESVDYYESMTLKLTDTKSERISCIGDYRNGENGKQSGLPSSTATLLTKTRKCQGKKRRQKRDFQKDILPGLSSLSRREVSEDLQTFGGLMRESGLSWQASGTRRSGCKKGRKHPNRTVLEINSPEEAEDEGEGEEGNIIGWGSTRRCRRQRWSSDRL